MTLATKGFRFTSRFLNNGVFIVDGLRSDDYQNGRHLFNQLRDLRDYAGVDTDIEYFHVSHSGEFREALSKIDAKVRNGAKPIIHFECHGDPAQGLQVGDVKDMISWSTLEPLLRRINLASGCDLGVVMGACYGMYAITPIRIHRPTPFYFLLGSQDELLAGTMREEMSEFYKTLFATNNLEAAVARVPSCKEFHAEKLLATSFAKYLIRGCIGKKRVERVERLVSELKLTHPLLCNREQLRRVRKIAKQRTKAENHSSALARQVKTFLPGRSCSFTFEELLQWVRQ